MLVFNWKAFGIVWVMNCWIKTKFMKVVEIAWNGLLRKKGYLKFVQAFADFYDSKETHERNYKREVKLTVSFSQWYIAASIKKKS